MIPEPKYYLDRKGRFVIENYNHAKAFSNFFPGISGLWGMPMWVFYVNRGQCIASFGIESKNKAIMEFQPADKAYRLTQLQGFRTFVKIKSTSKKKRSKEKFVYWEPFQNYLLGTDYKKKQTMSITAHDLTLEEINTSLGLKATVNYFTLPSEPYAALVRQLKISNLGKKDLEIEVIDGLPVIVPYGLNDTILKNISRTAEAWVKICNLENNAPFFQLNVELEDTPEVKSIEHGNYFFSFIPGRKKSDLLFPIVETANIFGQAFNFSAPEEFLYNQFELPVVRKISNKTPSAMSYFQCPLKAGKDQKCVSLFGYAQDQVQLNVIIDRVREDKYIENKAARNEQMIEGIKNFAFTSSSSDVFDRYASNTFLDNVLRGGLPISINTRDGLGVVNVFNRKHGDLERDYNYFVLAPTFFSQGNGNYRDVNQNRRNDVWFNTDVKDSHIIHFLNLVQADGYNPLILKGTGFLVDEKAALDKILTDCAGKKDQKILKIFLQKIFLPGALFDCISHNKIKLKVKPQEFFQKIMLISSKKELTEHGEGYWSDHWTYNLDLIESYLALYPEELRKILLEKEVFSFYKNAAYVLPRDQRYILTKKGLRQYRSVAQESQPQEQNENDCVLKTNHGNGKVYLTNLLGKLLCLIANKVASLDPSGIGIEMEADKPNWYDALNGLPGLLGSSISETIELKRFSQFILDAFRDLNIDDHTKIFIFDELANLIKGLSHLLSLDNDTLPYWHKSNDIKEHYRQSIREGIDGKETQMSLSEVKKFLTLVVGKTQKAMDQAIDREGNLRTYFYHEVKKYEKLDKSQERDFVYGRPLEFQKHALPLFLEGYVHALRVGESEQACKKLYQAVCQSELFDKTLKMYKVNANLSTESQEIGRARTFPSGWLENESIWLHMEYKFILELLRKGLYEEFYENFRHVLIPFLKPQMYGRSILENSSFIVSSVHEDESLHGRGFVARLSGSTAEFLHIWLLMNVGVKPFTLSTKNELILNFEPVLSGWLFTQEKAIFQHVDQKRNLKVIDLPKNTYAFFFLGSTVVVYHNPQRKNTYGSHKVSIKKMSLIYPQQKRPIQISAASIPAPYSKDIRNNKVERIDVFFGS